MLACFDRPRASNGKPEGINGRLELRMLTYDSVRLLSGSGVRRPQGLLISWRSRYVSTH